MRNIEKELKTIKIKLEETEKNYQNDQGSLEKLSDQLAKKVADNMIKPSKKLDEEIERIIREIQSLKDKIELTPRILKALKNKISSLENEKADLILQGKIEEQKAIGEELARVSGGFIKNLKLAIKENSEILSLWVSWNKLKEQTNFDQFEKKVSCGSQEMLGILGILVGEYDEGKIRRASVFNRIRL